MSADPKAVDALARFNQNFMPVPEAGCWLWTGDTGARRGYGRMRVGGNHAMRAHRLSWELHNGPVPDGLCVCHRCDTPSCVNPNHLFLATSEGNTADRVAKSRSKGGTTGAKAPHKRNVLTEGDSMAVIWLAMMNCRQDDIAEHFGCSQGTVSNTIRSALLRCGGAP